MLQFGNLYGKVMASESILLFGVSPFFPRLKMKKKRCDAVEGVLMDIYAVKMKAYQILFYKNTKVILTKSNICFILN
ncbi:MAG: hypothetical protein ACI4AA_09295 [Lachnospiraceae bacterium]